MTWRLKAFSPEDGWAVAAHDGHLNLIRPPYGRSDIVGISLQSLPHLLTQPGFVEPKDEHSDFPTVGALIDFLNGQVLASRSLRCSPLPDSGLGQALLAEAPQDVLVRFLDRVEREFIACGLLDQAHRALTVFIGLPAVIADGTLHSRALGFIDRIGAARASRQILVSQVYDFRVRFSRAVAVYGEVPLRSFCATVQRGRDLFGLSHVRR
jgi:hypothetical protein